MDKPTAAQRASLQKKKAEAKKHISQLENQQKILLNRLRKEERNARTSRLCNHGAILEGVFPAAVTTDGEEIKAFLIALSHLPGARELGENAERRGYGVGHLEQVRTYTPFRCRAPCRGLVASYGHDGGYRVSPSARSALDERHWRSAPPKPLPHSVEGGNIHRNISLPHPNHPAEQGQVRCGRCRLSER